MRRDQGIDAGHLLGAVDGIEVPKDATYWSLLPVLADAGAKLLVQVLRSMLDGTVSALVEIEWRLAWRGVAELVHFQVVATPQHQWLVSHAPKIKHTTARVRWDEQSASSLERLSRGISHQVCSSPVAPSTLFTLTAT